MTSGTSLLAVLLACFSSGIHCSDENFRFPTENPEQHVQTPDFPMQSAHLDVLRAVWSAGSHVWNHNNGEFDAEMVVGIGCTLVFE